MKLYRSERIIQLKYQNIGPIVVLMLLTLLLPTLEVPGSNPSQETDYPHRGYFWFSSVPPRKCRASALKYATIASFYILSNLSFTYHPFILRYIF
jgi:hypothetical protein